jgi:hypothetical protein
MKAKTTTFLLLALAMQTAYAAKVITVTDADFDPDAGQFGTSSLGTLTKDSNVVDGPGPQNLTFTISGLTIDNIGSGDDNVQITFVANAFDDTDTPIDIESGANNSSQGFFSAGGVWLRNQRYVTLEFSSMTVNLSGGMDNGRSAFLGFTNLTVQSWGTGDEAVINGTNVEFDSGDFTDGQFTLANTQSFRLETQNVGTGTDFRAQDWDFVFAVPEPSSTALIGLGGLALALRRRRA